MPSEFRSGRQWTVLIYGAKGGEADFKNWRPITTIGILRRVARRRPCATQTNSIAARRTAEHSPIVATTFRQNPYTRSSRRDVSDLSGERGGLRLNARCRIINASRSAKAPVVNDFEFRKTPPEHTNVSLLRRGDSCSLSLNNAYSRFFFIYNLTH